MPESVEFLSTSQTGGFSGLGGVVRSIANQMKEKTGVLPTLAAAASKLGRRGNQGALDAIIATGIAPENAPTFCGKRAYQGKKKEANATAKASDAEGMERKKEETQRRKKEQEEQARHEARQRKKEQEEHARQRKKEQEEQARQRKKGQEEQVPKARGKYKTFDDRMEDLKRFKETHGHPTCLFPRTNPSPNSASKRGTRIKIPARAREKG